MNKLLETFQRQEAMKTNPRLNEIVRRNYETSMQKLEWTQRMYQDKDFNKRTEKQNAALENARRNFHKLPFGALELKDTESPSVLAVQQKVQKLADRAALLQESTNEQTAVSLMWRDGFAVFRQEVADARAALNAMRISPVALSDQDKAAVDQLEQVISQYESIIPKEIFYDRTKTGGDKKLADQGGMILQLMGIVLAGGYTAYAAISGWKQKNFAPAMLGAGVTAAMIFGPKRLLEGKGATVVRETEFMATDDFIRFFRRHGIGGKEWAQAMEELQGQASGVRKLAKENKIENREKLLADMDLTDGTKKKIRRMISSTDELAMLAHVCSAGGAESKEVIVKYIEQGAPRQVFAIAKDPRALGK